MIQLKTHVNAFLVMSLIMLVICFFPQASAVDLCGVQIRYPGANITTNNAPCITVNSVTVNATGITSSYLSTDELREYNIYPTASTKPIVADWQNQSSTYSQWLVTSANFDTGMKITGTKLGNVYLNYLTAPQPTVWSYSNTTNNIAVYNAKFIQLLLNTTSPTPVTPPVFATVSFNQAPINLSWTSIPIGTGMAIGDSNNDGVADYVYTLSGSTKLTKQFGTYGTSSFDITLGTARNILYTHSNRILAYYETSADCNAVTTIQWNVSTGTNITASKLSQTTSIPTQNQIGGIINKNNNSAIFCGSAGSFVQFIHDSPNHNVTTTATANTITEGQFGLWQTTSTANQNHAYYYDNTYYGNALTQKNMSSSSTAAVTYPFTQNGIVFKTGNLGVTYSNLQIDPQIKKYYNGFTSPTTTKSSYALMQSFLKSPTASDISLLINIPPVLLNPAFTGMIPTYFLMSDGTTTYLAAIDGTNLYYTNYATAISQATLNRALADYVVDPANAFLTKTINSTLTTRNITLFYSNGTSLTYAANHNVALVSGYYWQVPTETRFYYPDYTNNLTPIPLDTFDSATSLWTIIVSNAPFTSAIMLTNATNYNGSGNPFTNSITFLQGDKSTTTSLVVDACYFVNVKDLSVSNAPWLFEGTVCGNGLNPKTIAYTNSLPFTFYTLTWGVTHSFTPATNYLQTIVRHNADPYTYTVVVYNSTGAPALTQVFNNVNGTDTRTFNVTGIAKPATLTVFGDGSQIYTAYLGSSLSFASVASFFHQYLSYQGFDLLSFIPIIFAAAFTRNTVGIGCALVVVLIATLSWLSIVVVPDSVIMVGIIVAVISMVGYRSYTG